eukprot:5962916-Pleurochrysis_carterae.AAC.4
MGKSVHAALTFGKRQRQREAGSNAAAQDGDIAAEALWSSNMEAILCTHGLQLSAWQFIRAEPLRLLPSVPTSLGPKLWGRRRKKPLSSNTLNFFALGTRRRAKLAAVRLSKAQNLRLATRHVQRLCETNYGAYV